MKRFVVLLILLYLSLHYAHSQSVGFSSFTLYKNLLVSQKGKPLPGMDLYIPGGQAVESGIGVSRTVKNSDQTSTSGDKRLFKIIFWVPKPGENNFPTPVAAFTGNGYAVASLLCTSNKGLLKNRVNAVKFMHDNASKYSLDMDTIGIIHRTNKGYRLEIHETERQKPGNFRTTGIIMDIAAKNDFDNSKLQTSEKYGAALHFFDQHLNNGKHIDSDPLTLKCPTDSWVDPVTYPIPGTVYRLFPTPSRGVNTLGSYLIHLPENYDSSGKSYPVIYWLHGGNGNSREGAWMCGKMIEAMNNGNMPHSIIVFVQGLPIGWYNNAVDGTMPVEDVVINDLIPYIDEKYRTIKKREGRAVEGMSMGGYGSLHLGFKYPELFGVVSSIAPSITTYAMERKEVLIPTFKNDTAYFNRNSPTNLVELNAEKIKGKTAIRLLIGDQDFLYNLIIGFHQQMQRLEIDHQFIIAKGAGHDYREVIQKLETDPFVFWKEAFRNF